MPQTEKNGDTLKRSTKTITITKTLKLSCGVSLEQHDLVYETYGHLNKAKNNAILIMGQSEDNLENSFENLIDVLEQENIDIDDFENSIVGLMSDEPNIAYLEEILHLVTQVGYANAYPEVFGEFKGSRISMAMDVARGGYFETVPQIYPESSWYHYYDKSCDYACMITEYFYWSLTSLLGSQINRFDEIA